MSAEEYRRVRGQMADFYARMGSAAWRAVDARFRYGEGSAEHASTRADVEHFKRLWVAALRRVRELDHDA